MIETSCMDNADFVAIDRKANAGRERLINPYRNLWDALMEIANHRVASVLAFAREWREIRYQPDYQRRRARCRFHLDWILSDEETGRLTFRDLVAFSDSPDLSDIDLVRDRILSAFEEPALRDLRNPIREAVMKRVASDFILYDRLGRQRKRDIEADSEVEEVAS